jgi:hypothetical protein
VQLQLTPVGVRQFPERILVAGARSSESLVGHVRIVAQDWSFHTHHR